jgi:heme/copper-type cytochrome/quinol oxidase subunit 3
VEPSVPIATRRSASGIPTGRLAVWWLLGSEVVLFGGLILSYLLRRLLYEHWSDSAVHTNTVAGATNTVVLLTSSLFVVLAHHAAEHHKNRQAFWYPCLTIGAGLTFLVVKGFEWGGELAQGYTLTTNLFWSFYYTASGLRWHNQAAQELIDEHAIHESHQSRIPSSDHRRLQPPSTAPG